VGGNTNALGDVGEGKQVVSLEEAARKIVAAVQARRNPALLIIARTDARATHGLDEALRRGRAFLAAGADILFIEAPQSVAEMQTIAAAFPGVPLVANMVEGVSQGYTRKLEIIGVGYRAALQGTKLVVSAGYSHQVEVVPPDGITFSVEGNTTVLVSGANKELVGNEAAKVRAIRPPEPYKGKGIKYQGERILRKAGKTGKK